MDDERPTPTSPAIQPGGDVSRLSEQEIAERITLLQGEIRRLEAALTAKRASREAASAVFKL